MPDSTETQYREIFHIRLYWRSPTTSTNGVIILRARGSFSYGLQQTKKAAALEYEYNSEPV